MGNLFNAAKKAEPTKKATEYLELDLGADYAQTLTELNAMKMRMKADETNSALIEEEIKSKAAQFYVEKSAELKRPAGNILVTAAGTGARFLCSFKDAYRKVDADSVDTLREKYGEDIVVTSRKYVFNNDVLEAYTEEISDAITSMFNRLQSSGKITPEQRDAILSNLFTLEEKHSIVKGAINTATTREDIGEFLADIQPQVAITDRTGK